MMIMSLWYDYDAAIIHSVELFSLRRELLIRAIATYDSYVITYRKVTFRKEPQSLNVFKMRKTIRKMARLYNQFSWQCAKSVLSLFGCIANKVFLRFSLANYFLLFGHNWRWTAQRVWLFRVSCYILRHSTFKFEIIAVGHKTVKFHAQKSSVVCV